MWNSVSKIVIALGFCLTIGFSWGCMGTPVYRMWHRSQWMEDEQVQPSLHARLEELDSLRSRAQRMSDAEQSQVAANLARQLADDPTPLYRAHVVRTLGELPVPAATQALRTAVEDREPRVRIEACAAWGRHGTSGDPLTQGRHGQGLWQQRSRLAAICTYRRNSGLRGTLVGRAVAGMVLTTCRSFLPWTRHGWEKGTLGASAKDVQSASERGRPCHENGF